MRLVPILTEDMQRLVRDQRLGFYATVCEDGSPNLSPKGSTYVLDDDHLLFADIRSPRTVANIRRGSLVEVNVVDPLARRGYRFKGTGEVHPPGTERYEHGLAARRRPPARDAADSDDPQGIPLDRDDVAPVELTPPAQLHLVVHGHRPALDKRARLTARVGDAGQLEDLAEADRVAADLHVARHPSHLRARRVRTRCGERGRRPAARRGPRPAAFARFYHRHVRGVSAFFHRGTGDAELAADLTAETFAAAVEGCHRYAPERGASGAWLYGIAHRQLATLQRNGGVGRRARRRLGRRASS